MPIIHFLNVKQGDCSIIEHGSGRVTVIDVCNAGPIDIVSETVDASFAKREKGIAGNFKQKEYPVNPVSYLKKHGIDSVFRFVATHPDMDHLDGIKHFFETFEPSNFWDTNNNEEKTFEEGSPFNQEDWDFYKSLRDATSDIAVKRLTLHSGARGKYYNQTEEGKGGGDGLSILASTPELVTNANECGDYNDCSYVILYRCNGLKVVFGGDSHDETWEHILKTHEEDVSDIDLLIAPHHGRDSGRSYDFLDVLKPKMTFFGNANSEHLAYDKWNTRKLAFITNNQAGCMIADGEDKTGMDIYVTHEPFAKSANPFTYYSEIHKAYFYKSLAKARAKSAS